MLDYYIEKDQQNRVKEAIAAVEEEADRNSDLYSEGEFDGVIALKPNQDKFFFEAYRQGYAQGTTYYWLKQYQIVIKSPF